MTKRPKGGRGKADEFRNEIIVILMKLNKHKYGPRPLGRVLHLHPTTVEGIFDRDKGKYPRRELSTV